jgi:phosphatidylglycerol lysyltransferase
MKSIRNAFHKNEEMGFVVKYNEPPQKDGLIQKLKQVSDEWLISMRRKEMVFTQGIFIDTELKKYPVFTVENSEDKVVAFANMVPVFIPDEVTYDMIRKSNSAPNGIMDFLMVHVFMHYKNLAYKTINLGLAPLSGLEQSQKNREKVIYFVSERIRSFQHFKGLYEYKDKFKPSWYNKYLIYENSYDLIKFPGALAKVSRPGYVLK